jgi:hypothetical protein
MRFSIVNRYFYEIGHSVLLMMLNRYFLTSLYRYVCMTKYGVLSQRFNATFVQRYNAMSNRLLSMIKKRYNATFV